MMFYNVTYVVTNQDYCVDIPFANRKLANTFNSQRDLTRAHGYRLARTAMVRLAVLRNAPTLSDVPTNPPVRRHQLSGRRKGQFAVDLVGSLRLIFIPANDPVPYIMDGGIDLDNVTAITILEVVDYH